ncbi:hypothetical protein LHYA1_G000464 [Lachnellula hyalina]|uniref:Uncharacterized protein n=1 Tax=Lachnellula hyalina TaxID=1316788 RepID=A0A8H8U1H2_9HELO|nr:uncharacterized protein LHYA1_G000464 [Lachnellula hyalina]TVY30386.1 hypothetical protein LHYA1_G000464 [Lachnellula hyalina]
MASALKSALPAHLKPSSLGAPDANAEFARKHHGKTQSHMGTFGMSNSSIILAFGRPVVTRNSSHLVE